MVCDGAKWEVLEDECCQKKNKREQLGLLKQV